MMGGRGGRGFGWGGGLERKTPPPGYVCHRCKVPALPTNDDLKMKEWLKIIDMEIWGNLMNAPLKLHVEKLVAQMEVDVSIPNNFSVIFFYSHQDCPKLYGDIPSYYHSHLQDFKSLTDGVPSLFNEFRF